MEIIGGQQLESVVELSVSQLSAPSLVCLLKQLDQGPIKRFDEPRRLHVDLLRLGGLLGQVFDLHDVELGDEGVLWVSFLVDVSCVLELSAEVELLLDFVLVLQNSIDP